VAAEPFERARTELLLGERLRDAGAAVLLSPRTTEHILTAISKKFGARSRTGLARRIAAEDVPAGLTDEA